MAHAKKGKKGQKNLNRGKKVEAVKPLTVCSGDFSITKPTDVSSANHNEIILRA